jgi:CTP:molybdopterin cytidylyltransferase MocA
VNQRHYAAVILAGGLSSRMQQFKPLLPLGRATVTDHVIDTFLSVNVEVLLVAGYRHGDIEDAIKKQPVNIVYNPDYEQGMFTSIQAGIRQLQPDYQSFFILPVDIPLVRAATLSRLMAAAEQNPQRIIYPVFRGQRGHPPLIPSGLVPAILGWGKGGGLKAVLESEKKLALEVAVADGNILLDMDTPEEYQAILERFRRDDIPTDEECNEILKTICHVTPDRIRHDYKVAEAAFSIAGALNIAGKKVDIELVRAAAILHDIAKGQPKHDIAGGEILRWLGFEKVGDIVAVHSDLAGGDTGLPLESKVVYIADKLIAGEKLVSLEERYHHPDFSPEIQALIAGRLEVAQLVKKELENLIGGSLESVIAR